MKRKNLDFPAFFDELFQTDWFGGTSNFQGIHTTVPAVNIKETDNDFMVEVAAPGKAKEDFNISLDHDLLTISSGANNEENTTNEKYTRKEFSYTSFKRSFKLPQTINKEQINATYEQGILKIGLPKREEDKVKPKRMIDIS